MKLDFVKMQAAGNDYIYVDCFRYCLNRPEDLAVKLSRRRYGVGSDGLITMHASENADIAIKIYNADGSTAKMCGNALRCVALYMLKFRKLSGNRVLIETDSGVRAVEKIAGSDSFSADMGKAEFINKNGIALTNVGNLHRVVFCDEITGADFKSLPDFCPDLYNTELCRALSSDKLQARVYERGSKETLSCGSGACAAAAYGVKCGYLTPGEITVDFPGGKLKVFVSSDFAVKLTGEAHVVYTGRIYV